MKKKKGSWFFRILIVLFIMYVALFIASQTGYYDKRVRDKTVMTDEQIKKFEEDIANNKTVDISSYLPQSPDYSNFLTKSANKMESKLEKIINNEAPDIWNFIKSLFIN